MVHIIVKMTNLFLCHAQIINKFIYVCFENVSNYNFLVFNHYTLREEVISF